MRTFTSVAPLPGNDAPVNPIDLVFQLGRTRRFGGWGNPEWTVLHHSMLTSLIYLKCFHMNTVAHALLHDAHEHITGDIPSPVKAAIGKDQVHALEQHLDKRIYEYLGMALPDDGAIRRVHVCDQAALFIEGYYFGPKGTFEHLGTVDWPSFSAGDKRIIIDLIKRMGLTEVSDKMEEW